MLHVHSYVPKTGRPAGTLTLLPVANDSVIEKLEIFRAGLEYALQHGGFAKQGGHGGGGLDWGEIRGILRGRDIRRNIDEVQRLKTAFCRQLKSTLTGGLDWGEIRGILRGRDIRRNIDEVQRLKTAFCRQLKSTLTGGLDWGEIRGILRGRDIRRNIDEVQRLKTAFCRQLKSTLTEVGLPEDTKRVDVPLCKIEEMLEKVEDKINLLENLEPDTDGNMEPRTQSSHKRLHARPV
eukprot:Nk52_evm2s375 gene=Nk52_evmTU2s375